MGSKFRKSFAVIIAACMLICTLPIPSLATYESDNSNLDTAYEELPGKYGGGVYKGCNFTRWDVGFTNASGNLKLKIKAKYTEEVIIDNGCDNGSGSSSGGDGGGSGGGNGGDVVATEPSPDPDTDPDLELDLDLNLAPISVTLDARKVVFGNDVVLQNEQFSFAVYEDDKTVATGTNDADGEIVFSGITYTQEGAHKYLIKETSEDGDGWTSDKTEHPVTVTVTIVDDTLFAQVTYPGGVIPTFTNKYTPGNVTLDISKLILDNNGIRTGDGTRFVIDL